MSTHPINLYYELEPEKNHFPVIYVDITHRCNMECANCFIPNREAPDMDKDRLYDVLKSFGFVKEAVLKEHYCFGGDFKNVIIYSLFNREK